jgi:hypothetical protein
MQVIELASIIGLICRTQALSGRVGVVAGVLGLLRRSTKSSVGGYRAEMERRSTRAWTRVAAGLPAHTRVSPRSWFGVDL